MLNTKYWLPRLILLHRPRTRSGQGKNSLWRKCRQTNCQLLFSHSVSQQVTAKTPKYSVHNIQIPNSNIGKSTYKKNTIVEHNIDECGV